MSTEDGNDVMSPPRVNYVWLTAWILRVLLAVQLGYFVFWSGMFMLVNQTLVYVYRGDHVQLVLWVVVYVVLAVTLLRARTAALATILFLPLLMANRAFVPHSPPIFFYLLMGFNVCAVAFVLFSERHKLSELVAKGPAGQ